MPSPYGHCPQRCSIPGKQDREPTEKCWLGSRERPSASNAHSSSLVQSPAVPGSS